MWVPFLPYVSIVAFLLYFLLLVAAFIQQFNTAFTSSFTSLSYLIASCPFFVLLETFRGILLESLWFRVPKRLNPASSVLFVTPFPSEATV